MDNIFQIGSLFHGRYILKRILGRGAFGEVWLADDTKLDIEVAIKIYIALDDQGIECFKSEYRYAYGLSHPNLVHINYFDVCGNCPYLVMPYCPNGSSNRYVGNVSEDMMWRFLRDVASGLAYLHHLNPPMVHQDIKPVNILIDRNGTFLISDFGISRQIRNSMSRSGSSMQAGTLAYMSPERFERDPMPVMASDVWSLGATMFELMTGDVPFDDMGGAKQKSGAEIPFLNSSHSVLLKSIVEDCLAKYPWDRPTAQQLADFAQSHLNGNDVEKPWRKIAEQSVNYSGKTHIVNRTHEPSNRKPVFKIVLMAVALIIAVGFFGWKLATGNIDREQRKAEKLAYENCTTLKEFRDFVKNYPDGKYMKKASEKIAKLVDDSINSAKKNEDENADFQETKRKDVLENIGDDSNKEYQSSIVQLPENSGKKEEQGSLEKAKEIIGGDNKKEEDKSSGLTAPVSSGGLTDAGNSGKTNATITPTKPQQSNPKSEEEAYQRCMAQNATIEDCLYYLDTYGKNTKHSDNVMNKFNQLYYEKWRKCKTVEEVDAFLREHDAIMRRARIVGGTADWTLRKKAEEKRAKLANGTSF